MRAFLPDHTRISQVHLRTANLEGALAFYCGVLGLKLHHGPGPKAILSAAGGGPGLLALTEELKARQPPPRTTGLYHCAIRYPRRQDLGQACRRLVQSGYPVAGASDHGVSEAVYLSDPEGNGVELYADRPRAQWPWRGGQLAMVSEALGLDALLAVAAKESAAAQLPPQTDIGHVHLQVADLAAAERFYSEFLGLAVTQRSCPGALFFAAAHLEPTGILPIMLLGIVLAYAYDYTGSLVPGMIAHGVNNLTALASFYQSPPGAL